MAQARTFSDQDPIRVFLLDDHEVVRRGLTDLLDAEPDISVVGDAGNVEHALARGPALRPDVAVLDVRLPDGDGISVCRELRSQMPELACLMLTSFDDEEALLDAIMVGAAGYVLKQIKGSDLVSAVRTVASGQSMLDPATTARLMSRLRADPAEEAGAGPGARQSLAPGERHPRPDRGRAHQPGDRQEAVPLGEDGEEPHLPTARQTRRPAPGPGSGAGQPSRESRNGRPSLHTLKRAGLGRRAIRRASPSFGRPRAAPAPPADDRSYGATGFTLSHRCSALPARATPAGCHRPPGVRRGSRCRRVRRPSPPCSSDRCAVRRSRLRSRRPSP